MDFGTKQTETEGLHERTSTTPPWCILKSSTSCYYSFIENSQRTVTDNCVNTFL